MTETLRQFKNSATTPKRTDIEGNKGEEFQNSNWKRVMEAIDVDTPEKHDTEPKKPDIADFTKEERLKKAKKMMDEVPKESLSLEEGEIIRIAEDHLIEKTSSGFNLFHIQDE